jgi:hypothetical protein
VSTAVESIAAVKPATTIEVATMKVSAVLATTRGRSPSHVIQAPLVRLCRHSQPNLLV